MREQGWNGEGEGREEGKEVGDGKAREGGRHADVKSSSAATGYAAVELRPFYFCF